MSNTGMSSRNIAVQFNVNHTVIGRLIQRYHQTGTVNDRPRSEDGRLPTEVVLDGSVVTNKDV
jgi:transposase